MGFPNLWDYLDATVVLALITKYEHAGCESRYAKNVRSKREHGEDHVLGECRNCNTPLVFYLDRQKWGFKEGS